MAADPDITNIISRRGGSRVPVTILLKRLLDANASLKNRLLILKALAFLLNHKEMIKYARRAGLADHLANPKDKTT